MEHDLDRGQVSPSPNPSWLWSISTGQRHKLHLGDELPAGAPGAKDNICRICNGSGKNANGEQCSYCGGTGKVIESVAGWP